MFAPVTYVSDSVRTGPLLGKLLFLVVEPLQGLEGLVAIRFSPPPERFDRDGVGCQMVLAPIQIAGTGDGDALGHGIEASLTFKFFAGRLHNRLSTGPHPNCSSRSFLDGN